MTTFAVVIVICVVLIMIDVIPLYQNQQWLSFFVYISLLVIAVVISILLDRSFNVPSPADFIEKIIIFVWGLKEE